MRASCPLFETISTLNGVSHSYGFIMVITGQGVETVVRDASMASPFQVVIYRGLC